jgi:hypothetical protein
MAKMTVKRVGVLSVAKTQGIVGMVLGLIIGVIYGVILMLFGAVMMTSEQSGSGGAAAGGFIAGLLFMIGFPIGYGILSFIAGAITAFVYNMAAKFAGGIELELESAEPMHGAPPPPQYGNPY